MDVEDNQLIGDPIEQFHYWYEDAVKAGIYEPDAAVVSSVDHQGSPTSRFVLVRKIDSEGFVFFTNYNSDKATAFALSPNVSLTFGWLPLHRQVRIQGKIEKATAEESNDYFLGRPRGHQIGAWASPQSQVIESRDDLLKRYKEIEDKFKDKTVPRPENWGGYRVRPNVIEFWQGKQDRLHDRFRYLKLNEQWEVQRLAP
ncbi:MAG: pyridoxamine 5'-phosphate oxidase [Actinomycetota bacterium]|nr:pyridoxamine 5'-phosphate oxidase [Actinomycetota bacterium]